MRRLFITAMVALGAILVLSGTALAQPKLEFKMGFEELANRIPAIVGEPVEDEQSAPSGDFLRNIEMVSLTKQRQVLGLVHDGLGRPSLSGRG